MRLSPAEFIVRLVSQHYGDAKKVKLVQDNLNTRTEGLFYEHLSTGHTRELSALTGFMYTQKARLMAEHGRNRVLDLVASVFRLPDQFGGSVNGAAPSLDVKGVKISWSFSVAATREKPDARYKEANPEN